MSGGTVQHHFDCGVDMKRAIGMRLGRAGVRVRATVRVMLLVLSMTTRSVIGVGSCIGIILPAGMCVGVWTWSRAYEYRLGHGPGLGHEYSHGHAHCFGHGLELSMGRAWPWGFVSLTGYHDHHTKLFFSLHMGLKHNGGGYMHSVSLHMGLEFT